MKFIFLLLALPALASPAAQAQATVFEPGVISRGKNFGLTLTPDGQRAYFVHATPKRDTLVLLESVREKGGWQPPTAVAPLGGVRTRNIDPFVTPDGKRLIYNSARHPEDSTRTDFDIWAVDLAPSGAVAGTPYRLGGAGVNSPAADFYATQAANGNLYFASTRPGGAGKVDIYVATLDYQAGQLRLVPPAAFVPPPGAAPVALRREGNKLLVTATAAGVTGWYVVDTGAGNALTFTTPTVEQHRLRQAFPAPVRMLTGVSVGGYTYGDLVRVPTVQLGPHRLEHVLAELSLAQQGLFASPAYAGNLGGELWWRFTVTLDYAGGQLYLAPNASWAEPFEGPRAGLAPHWEQGRATVLDVAAGSPAAAAGVQVGDELLALDGAPMSQVGPAALRQALRQAPGTSLRLRLRRGSAAEQEVVLVLREML